MDYLRIILAFAWVICIILAIIFFFTAKFERKRSYCLKAMKYCQVAMPLGIMAELCSTTHSWAGTILSVIILMLGWLRIVSLLKEIRREAKAKARAKKGGN